MASVRQSASPPQFNPAYFDTVFVVPQPPPVWPRRFAVVTAHNPDGKIAPDAANDEYARALDSHLRDLGIGSFPVVGASPDLTHHEAGHGFAVDHLAVAAAISARFRQEAFFWIEDDVVFICVDDSGEGWETARWSERLVRPERLSTRP